LFSWPEPLIFVNKLTFRLLLFLVKIAEFVKFTGKRSVFLFKVI